jgi:hypothetical protein
MRDGLNTARRKRRTRIGVLTATALVSGMLMLGTQATGAAPTTKTMDVACVGVDEPSKKLLSTANLPALPVTATVDAPAFVEPGQTDVPVSVSWALSLPASLVDTLAGLGVTSADVKDAKADTEVSGPTSTKIIEGRPANQTITLVKGSSLNAGFGPFAGQLDDIGNSGVIKLRNQSVDFTVEVVLGGTLTSILLTCPIGATVATIPVKVAGSPDIKQPIQEEAVAGENATIDVLGQYVTNGKDKSGVVRQVDPSTLKIVEGPGTVQGGKLVIPSPAAGASADTTFEVCAGTVEVAPATEGIDEVQKIRVYRQPGNAFKQTFAATFSLGGEPGQPAWMFNKDHLLTMNLGGPKPWANNMWSYALLGAANPSFHIWPSETGMKIALETIPEIGAGNVEVTRGEMVSEKGVQYRDYEVKFVGAKGKQDLPDLKLAHAAAFLPHELLENLMEQLKKLTEDKPGGPTTTTTTIPGGLSAKEYLAEIKKEMDQAWTKDGQGDLNALQTYFDKLQLWLSVFGDNAMNLIDMNAAVAMLTDLFPKKPEISWVTQGEAPKAAEIQALCSQGVVTLRATSVQGATTNANPVVDNTNTGGEPIAFAG